MRGSVLCGLLAMGVATNVAGQDWVGWHELGVPIVETNGETDWPEWTLTGPSLVLGAIDGPDSHLFTQIWDVERLGDGRLVVVEASSYEIRVFDPSGEHLLSFGRRGGGPEEFGGPPWVSIQDSLLVVWDPGHYRVSRYNTSGDLLQQVTIRDRILEAGITPFPNGTVWETVSRGQLWTGPKMLPVREGLNGRYNRLVWIWDEGIRDLGTFRQGRTYFILGEDRGYRGVRDIFSPATFAAVSKDGRIAVSEGSGADVLVLSPDGTPSLVLSPRIERRPVTAEAVRAERGRLPAIAPRLGVPLRQLEEAHSSIPLPDSVPALGDLRWGPDGSLWLGRRAGDVWEVDEYVVVGEDGTVRGRVRMPEGADAIMLVGRDELIVRRRDDFDVQYLEVYGIVR